MRHGVVRGVAWKVKSNRTQVNITGHGGEYTGAGGKKSASSGPHMQTGRGGLL